MIQTGLLTNPDVLWLGCSFVLSTGRPVVAPMGITQKRRGRFFYFLICDVKLYTLSNERKNKGVLPYGAQEQIRLNIWRSRAPDGRPPYFFRSFDRVDDFLVNISKKSARAFELCLLYDFFGLDTLLLALEKAKKTHSNGNSCRKYFTFKTIVQCRKDNTGSWETLDRRQNV